MAKTRQLNRTSSLSENEVKELWNEYKKVGGESLRNQLMEHYLPLVRYNAERVHTKLPDEVDVEDLMSAGIFGLMDAIDAFDRDRGVKFETYCAPRIRGAILDELRSMDWVPRLVRSRSSQVDQARKPSRCSSDESPPKTRSLIAWASTATSTTRSDATPAPSDPFPLPQVVRNRLQQGRPRDRRPRRRQADQPLHRRLQTRPQGPDHQGPLPRRTTHRHPLLLRGDDHEGDRHHARPLRVPRQPDALLHPRPAQGPAPAPRHRARRRPRVVLPPPTAPPTHAAAERSEAAGITPTSPPPPTPPLSAAKRLVRTSLPPFPHPSFPPLLPPPLLTAASPLGAPARARNSAARAPRRPSRPRRTPTSAHRSTATGRASGR